MGMHAQSVAVSCYKLFLRVVLGFSGDMVCDSLSRLGGAYFLPLRTLGEARILPGDCNILSLGAVRP